MAEINVTPMVDVMLVLLIIFMVTAPMMTQGMDVNLPKVNTGPMETDGEQVAVSLNAKGEIYIDEILTDLDNLGYKVKRVMDVKNTEKVFLRADETIPYGQVALVMSEIRRAGITNLGLVTEPEPVPGPEKKPSK